MPPKKQILEQYPYYGQVVIYISDFRQKTKFQEMEMEIDPSLIFATQAILVQH
jgi:hypothetical protein